MCVNLRLDNYLVPKESIYSVALCTCVVIWHLKKYYSTLLCGSFEPSDDETVDTQKWNDENRRKTRRLLCVTNNAKLYCNTLLTLCFCSFVCSLLFCIGRFGLLNLRCHAIVIVCCGGGTAVILAAFWWLAFPRTQWILKQTLIFHFLFIQYRIFIYMLATSLIRI